MKIIFLGTVLVVIGGQVQGVAIPGVDKLVGRHHRHGLGRDRAAVLSSLTSQSLSETSVASLDLNTVVGNGAGLVGVTTATDSTTSTDSTLTANTSSLTLPTGILTDALTTPTDSVSTSTDSTTRSRRTVTVTKTEIALANTTATITGETNTLPPTIQAISNFGGAVGALFNNSALTAGSVVTIAGGADAFGGVVGAAILTTDSSITATETTSSSDSITTTTDAASSTVVRGAGAFGGVVGLDPIVTTTTESNISESSISTTSLDSATTSTILVSVISIAGGAGAFGGVVGVDAVPTNLVSTAISFGGFGGIAGLAAVPTNAARVRKRDTFATQISLSLVDGGGAASSTIETSTATPSDSLIFPVSEAAATTSPGDDIVFVTQTTTIDPVVTVFADPSTQTPTPPTSTDSTSSNSTTSTTSTTATTDQDDVVTVTQIVTSTIAPATSTPTVLSIGDVFPNCANFTSNITALANITIPNIVLPSNLTLAQLFGIGENIDCGTLLNLLGVNTTVPARRRRGVDVRRAFRYRLK